MKKFFIILVTLVIVVGCKKLTNCECIISSDVEDQRDIRIIITIEGDQKCSDHNSSTIGIDGNTTTTICKKR